MTIGASAGRLVLLEFLFDGCHLWIRGFLTVFVAGGANRYRNIRSQTAQRAGARDIDVAGCAFQHMLAFAALMTELCRNALRPVCGRESSRQFVTSDAIVTRRLLALPVTSEASVVSGGLSFESSGRRHKGIHPAGRRWG